MWRGVLLSRAALYASVLVYVLSQGLILWVLRDVGIGDVGRLQHSFSAAPFRAVIEAWDSAQRDAYLRHYSFDLPHGVWYAWMLAAALMQSAGYAGRVHLFRLCLIPVAAALCDLVENLLHLHMLGPAGEITNRLVFFSGCASALKWGLAALSLGLIWRFWRQGRARGGVI